jgi:hypothetical protein
MSQYVPIDYQNNMSPVQYSSFIGGGDKDDNNIYYLVYFILFVIVVFALYKFFISYNALVNKVNDQVPIQQNINYVQDETQKRKNISINVNQNDGRPPVNPIREYDYRSLYDPLVAPRRRDDYDLPWVPYPTRGHPRPYHKIGLLIDKKANDNDRYKILLLMGRNTYSGSRVFEYYATENNQSGIKFDVNSKRRNELQTDDIVTVNGLNRHYVVTLDQQLGYSYDPYM